MSLFLRIQNIDPSEHTIKDVATAAWKALQRVKQRSQSSWTPVKRRNLDQVWQVDRANEWQVRQMPKGYELFSYYGEDQTAAKIVEMIPELLTPISTSQARSD